MAVKFLDGITIDGDVGIGTTAPVEKLDVHGNIKVTGVGNGLNLDTLGSTNSNGVKVINNYETVVYSGRGSAGFGVFGNQEIRLGFGNGATTSNADLLINSSGNVGIGTITPSTKLHVQGDTLLAGGYVEVKQKLYADRYFSSANGPFGGPQEGINAVIRIFGKANVHTMTFASGLLIGYTCEGEECEPQPPPYNEE